MAAPRGSRVRPTRAYRPTTEATLYLDKVTVTLTEPLSRNFMQYTTQTHRLLQTVRKHGRTSDQVLISA